MNKTTVIAIITIGVLELVAILRGIDGAALSTALAVIAGLGGYEIGKKKAK